MKTTSITKCSLFLCILLIGTLLKGYGATFVVDNVADTDNLTAYTAADGTNTLRKCMRLANANVNTPTIDIINFAAGLTGGITITLTSPLPFITDPLFIDGFTANGYTAPNPRVSILAGANPNAFNVAPGGNNSTIRGFAISNTAFDGIYINGTTNVTISGCWIGLLATGALPGTAAAKVGGHGIYITGGSNNCNIGIATLAGKNVISGCGGHGVVVVGSSGVVFKNNYVGTDITGVSAISNNIHGINLNNSPSCIIGGSAANEGNLISGNTKTGLVLANASSNAIVKGNKIGTNLAGTAAIANGEHGINIFINVLNTTIGGGLAGEGNLISGNALCGINIAPKCHFPTILGNLIGVNAAGGLPAIPNNQHGIDIDSSNGAIIGGNTKGKRNIVSGNGNVPKTNGISISNSNNHFIKGNFIGTDITGLIKIANFDTGLSMTNSTGDSIGGQTYMERNVISGNGNIATGPPVGPIGYGIYMSNIDNSRFYGNYVGTDSTGKAVLGNNLHGIHAEAGSDFNSWYNNVVSGNTHEGFDILTCASNVFYGNFIGLGVDGTTKVANNSNGMRVGQGANNNIIGGAAAGQRNYISGNGNGAVPAGGSHGIDIDVWSTGNIIKGNYIGSDITGMVAIGNSGAGIMFLQDANSNTVGGTAAGEGNLLCCSTGDNGIRMNISNSNVVYGNLIGVNSALSLATGFGNNQYGVFMVAYNDGSGTYTSNSNIIGGLGAGAANIIANNGSDGVNVFNAGGTSSNFDPIIGNKIYCNGGLGINMQTNAATENEGVPAPNVTSSTANAISGTGVTGNTIHVYRNQYSDGARCDCEGEIYVGTTTVAGGTWSLTHSLGLTASQALSVTATQTNSTNSTSEFWVCSVPLPVDLLSLEAKKINTIVSVNFTVSNENNINLYRILKSKDGINFEIIGSVTPVNGPGVHAYSFEDLYPSEGINYYRIQTVENDGRAANSKIVYVNTNSVTTYLYPNPAIEEVTIVASDIISRVELHNTLGQLVYEKNIEAPELVIPLTNLSSGVYYVKVYEGENVGVYKLEKK